MQRITEKLNDLARLNTDTYCADLSFTAFLLANTANLPPRFLLEREQKVACLANRIITERSREAAP